MPPAAPGLPSPGQEAERLTAAQAPERRVAGAVAAPDPPASDLCFDLDGPQGDDFHEKRRPPVSMSIATRSKTLTFPMTT